MVLGNFGTALVMVLIAFVAAVDGRRWLLHSDNHALEMLAYALPGLVLWIAAGAVDRLVRVARRSAFRAVEGVTVIHEPTGTR